MSPIDGFCVVYDEGCIVASEIGLLVDSKEGNEDGEKDEEIVVVTVGTSLVSADGSAVGLTDSSKVGLVDETCDGELVLSAVGSRVSNAVGEKVGVDTGSPVILLEG